jgi:hypothetical protein
MVTDALSSLFLSMALAGGGILIAGAVAYSGIAPLLQ